MASNTHFDWIVIGSGMTGVALAYELVQQGLKVLLVERCLTLQGATRYSYGGLAYWSGTNQVTRLLCQEGKAVHQSLSDELDGDTEFRELDLLLTIAPSANPEAIASAYSIFATPPTLLSVEAACQLEPLLNPAAIAGALTVQHGHIAPEKTAALYLQAFQRAGGVVVYEEVSGFLKQSGQGQVGGVRTDQNSYYGDRVVVCAGGLSRSLLHAHGLQIRHYFTHAAMIETPAATVKLQTLVMPAETKRFELEATVSTAEADGLWDEPGHELAPGILDAGAIQFRDGSIRMGQISRVLTDPGAAMDLVEAEASIRQAVAAILPGLAGLPGSCHHCLVAFSSDRLPLVGQVPGTENLFIFSGFSNPLAIVPALAKRFAAHLNGEPDQIILQLTPARFA